jgi:hypothetical protein
MGTPVMQWPTPSFSAAHMMTRRIEKLSQSEQDLISEVHQHAVKKFEVHPNTSLGVWHQGFPLVFPAGRRQGAALCLLEVVPI